MAVTTWDGALADPRVIIHWLLILTSGGGTVARFADDDVEVSGTPYAGALEVVSAPRITADPYRASASSQGARVTILPLPDDAGAATTTRPYDLDEIYGASFLQMGAKLYRWAEGTAFSEADLLLDGLVDGAELDGDGELTLDLVDFSIKYDRKFPRYRISSENFANVYEDDQDMGYSILYGTFVRAPIPTSNTTADYALGAEGTISTLSQCYLDDAAVSTEAKSAQTDGSGVAYTRISVGTAINDKNVTISGVGYVDDAEGYYGGTADAVLTHPADQLHHCSRNYAEWPQALVNAASFVALREETPGYVGAIQVLSDDRTSFFDLCAEAGKFMRAAVFVERGLLTARRLDFTRPPSLTIADEANLLDIENIGWGEKSNLLSKLTLRYNWGWRKKRKTLDFKSSTTLDSDTYAPFAENLAFLGVEEEEIETKMLGDTATAETAIGAIAELYGKLRKVATVTVTREAHDLRIYDVVEITTEMMPSATGAGWTAKRFVVTGILCGLDNDTLTLLEV